MSEYTHFSSSASPSPYQTKTLMYFTAAVKSLYVNTRNFFKNHKIDCCKKFLHLHVQLFRYTCNVHTEQETIFTLHTWALNQNTESTFIKINVSLTVWIEKTCAGISRLFFYCVKFWGSKRQQDNY